MSTAMSSSMSEQSGEPYTPVGASTAAVLAAVTEAGELAVAMNKLAPTHIRPKRGWFQWVPTDSRQLASTESCILHHLKHPFVQRQVAGLNTVSSKPIVPAHKKAASGSAQPRVERHIVLLHGFGGGLAMWVANFNFLVDALSAGDHVAQVHAVDLPGFARSERHPMVRFSNETDAMDYMTGHLANWARALNIDRPIQGADGQSPMLELVGHSFGAYVSATFAHRYPAMTKRVVLCDPWGVPKKPEGIEDKMARKHRMLLKLFYTGNPFSVLRGAGPWGPTLLPSVRKDFADRWTPIIGDANIFFDYVFHCNASRNPTGEQAFQACCTGPVYAIQPLEKFVPLIPATVDLAVLYGSHTWMDKSAGVAMMQAAEACRGKGCQNSYGYVANAGHQLNTDNVEGFNVALARELRIPGYDD